MLGTTNGVLFAAIVFIAIHVASSTPLRAALVARLGEQRFMALFSVVSALVFAWLIVAYARAPMVTIWVPPQELHWVPTVLMPVAFVFLVAAITTRSPMMAGMGETIREPEPVPGILTVTRHPLFWGLGLWAVSHLAVRGDKASMVLFGTIALLAFAGMPLVDRKKEEQFGADWGPVALRTSILPFAAALQGRTAIDWRGIGWWRAGLGLLLYLLFMGFAHEALFGVAPHP